MQQAVFRFQFSWAGTRPAPTVVRSSLVLAHTLPERLFAGPAGALQVLAHLLEGVAIDLTARVALAQDLQCVRPERWPKMRGPASPAEAAARHPAESRDNRQPEQRKQGPETHAPCCPMVHMSSPFYIYVNFHMPCI